MKNICIFFLALFALAVVASCQSVPRNRPVATSGTSFELSYVLGHDSHRFVAKNHKGRSLAQSFVNEELLKEGMVDTSRYEELLTQVAEFVRAAPRGPASDSECRGSFRVTLRQGVEVQTFQGCRSQDAGSAFSRITRDAEFLLYSKKL